MKDPAAVELGRRGGAKGGHARAAKLSPKRRREIAQAAARVRWAAPVPADFTKDEGNDEITVVDLPGAIRLPSGQVKPRIHCCGGTGFESFKGLGTVVPCWCPAGRRLECARTDALPLAPDEAKRLATRIGLQVDA